MEEIDLKELFNYFISKIFIIILITITVLTIGFSYDAFFKTPMYNSYTTVLLKGEDTITSSDITLNKNLVNTYSEIIKSRKVIRKVIENLKLDYGVEELQKNISVSNINDTEIIKISVSDTDNYIAKNIANEAANVFTAEIINYFNIQNIGIIDYAEVSELPYNINILKSIIIYLFMGLILGVSIVFVMFYFDNTVKTSEEIENKLKLPVIGMISIGGKK